MANVLAEGLILYAVAPKSVMEKITKKGELLCDMPWQRYPHVDFSKRTLKDLIL